MAARKKTKSKSSAKTLKDVARKIGSTLGKVAGEAQRTVRGLKAAAEASSIAYTGAGKSNKRAGRPAKRNKKRVAAR